MRTGRLSEDPKPSLGWLRYGWGLGEVKRQYTKAVSSCREMRQVMSWGFPESVGFGVHMDEKRNWPERKLEWLSLQSVAWGPCGGHMESREDVGGGKMARG